MRIYIDVSETVASRLRTGIQRVVRETVAHSFLVAKKLGVEVIPVVVSQGRFYKLDDLDSLLEPQSLPELTNAGGYTHRSLLVRGVKRVLKYTPILYPLAIKLLHTYRSYCANPYRSKKSIEVEKGDVLLLLDSFWSGMGALGAAAKYRCSGKTVVAVIYDLIPITHPQFYDSELPVAFKKQLCKALESTDGIIAISRAVAGDVETFVRKNEISVSPSLLVDYYHLGADFSHKSMELPLDADWEHDLWGDAPVFMMVGTIEPRKGHAFVIDAFEHRWQEGKTEKLFILGKVGWKTDLLIKRILNSPYYGKYLFMLNDASDAQLKDAYRRAYACVMASYVEGFGLPVIESLQYGVPVIASDIPVFKEIAGNDAEFFTLGEITSFNRAVDALQRNYKETKAKLERFKWLTWEESTEQLLRKVSELAQQVAK